MDNAILQGGLRLINRYNDIAKKPRHYGTDTLLYPSEIHVIDVIGLDGNNTTTKLADQLGITKGGVSQIVAKLFEKDMIVKSSGGGINEVYLSLSEKGKIAFEGHIELHRNLNARINDIILNVDDRTKDEIRRLLNAIDDELMAMGKTE